MNILCLMTFRRIEWVSKIKNIFCTQVRNLSAWKQSSRKLESTVLPLVTRVDFSLGNGGN